METNGRKVLNEMGFVKRPSLTSSLCHFDSLLRLHDNYTGEVISCDNRIAISTPYVPSFQLLTLQWRLTRIVAMVGVWYLSKKFQRESIVTEEDLYQRSIIRDY